MRICTCVRKNLVFLILSSGVTILVQSVQLHPEAEEGILNRGYKKLWGKMSLRAKIVYCTI